MASCLLVACTSKAAMRPGRCVASSSVVVVVLVVVFAAVVTVVVLVVVVVVHGSVCFAHGHGHASTIFLSYFQAVPSLWMSS